MREGMRGSTGSLSNSHQRGPFKLNVAVELGEVGVFQPDGYATGRYPATFPGFDDVISR